MDWSVFPEGHEYVQADESGFRGFIVEFYNIISDVVVQDGYQSVLNLRTTLDLLSRRHTRFKRCSRETDGAGSYNSIFVALMTLQLGTGQDITHPHTHSHTHTREHTPHALAGGKNGNVKVVSHNHNEPGHGADICDTAGANCIRECMRCTKRTGLSIIAAYRTAKALKRDVFARGRF